MNMVLLKCNFILLLLFHIVIKAQECNTADTIFQNGDTLIKKLKCYENGQKKYLFSFKNGNLHGANKSWHSNGKLCNIQYYFEGNEDGVHNGWDTTGFLTVIKKYSNGKPIGKHEHYYGKNKPKEFTNYNDSGQKHGLCESWREDGTRKDSIVYHNGSIKEIRAYYQNGKPRYWVKNINIYNSKKIEASYYDTTGKICGRIRDGNGTYILFSDDAKERWIETYKNGEEVASRKLKPDENPDWK